MSANTNESGNEFGLGDLEKTVTLNALLELPFEQRDQDWVNSFLETVAEANLKLGQPEVVIASDGFPYVQLESVHTDENFQAFVINKQLPTLLMQGFGVVVNPQNQQPDWVFSYGDIVNYELNDTFYTEHSIFSHNKENVAIGSDEKVLIGQPSDAILPKYLKNQLREFLKHAGIQTPKVMLIARNPEDEQNVKQDLVFNFTPHQFANEEQFQQVGGTIAWFLPKHYSFLFVDENAVENGFQEF